MRQIWDILATLVPIIEPGTVAVGNATQISPLPIKNGLARQSAPPRRDLGRLSNLPTGFLRIARFCALVGADGDGSRTGLWATGKQTGRANGRRMLWTILRNRIGMRVDLGIAARPLNGGDSQGWNMKNPSFEKEGEWYVPSDGSGLRP